MMNQDVIWTQYSNQTKGKILYESQAILAGCTNLSHVTLYEKLITFDKMCVQYNFDLKFGIKDGTIKFQQDQKIMSFTLPKNDEKQWRSVLRLYLNQKGFHQTFKPIKKIGKGNFASVYLVQKIENKCKYAVKAFSKQAAYSEQNGKQCLIKQIQIMRHLDNKNLMRLQQVFQSDNSLYIVFQLLEGGQLYDKIKQKYQFSQTQVQSVIHNLLEGLKEMHSKGIMHRDLKPQNILIRTKGSIDCVIADFGLAEFVDQEQYLFVRCGTPGYVAPEVINIKDMKQKYGCICDIFSLGLIFHVLLMGFSVFRKKTYNEVLAQNRACNFTFDQLAYDQISTQALDLLKKMLRVDPQQRITAQQALDHPYFNTKTQNISQLHTPNLKNSSKLSKMSKLSRASTIDQDQVTPVTPTHQPINKDSCVQFKLGKQNIMNGHLQTDKDTGKTKVSMFGQAMAPGRVSKISKFSKAN